MENLNKEKLNMLLDELSFSKEDKSDFWSIINPIIKHEEFQKRLDATIYSHHRNISLGSHILKVAIITYYLAKQKAKKNPNIDVKTAVIIAMFHDLYELPWQHSKIVKSKTVNRHGFTHPLEAIINSSTWYPEYFTDEKTRDIIIDGIVHHMYPFPVRAITTNFESTELNNLDKLDSLDSKIKSSIIKSTLHHHIGNISFSKSKYKEGKIMSKADKIVSFKKDFNYLNYIKLCLIKFNYRFRKS